MGKGGPRVPRRLGGLSTDAGPSAQALGLSAKRRRELYRIAKAICRSAEERAEARDTDPIAEVYTALIALACDDDLTYEDQCEVERYCMAAGYV